MQLEIDLQHSPACAIDIENIMTDDGAFLIVILRNKAGDAVGHWVTNKESQRDAVIESLSKFKEVKLQ